MTVELGSLGFQFFLGALAMFLGILLWARTREPAWVFMVLSVFVLYVQIVLGTLEALGFIRLELGDAFLDLVFELALKNGHVLFLCVGLFLAYKSKSL